MGSYDPKVALPYIEEQLTLAENEVAEAFLSWCHQTNTPFGHGTINGVFKQFVEAQHGHKNKIDRKLPATR